MDLVRVIGAVYVIGVNCGKKSLRVLMQLNDRFIAILERGVGKLLKKKDSAVAKIGQMGSLSVNNKKLIWTAEKPSKVYRLLQNACVYVFSLNCLIAWFLSRIAVRTAKCGLFPRTSWRSVVCLCWSRPCKTAEPIEMSVSALLIYVSSN